MDMACVDIYLNCFDWLCQINLFSLFSRFDFRYMAAPTQVYGMIPNHITLGDPRDLEIHFLRGRIEVLQGQICKLVDKLAANETRSNRLQSELDIFRMAFDDIPLPEVIPPRPSPPKLRSKPSKLEKYE